MNKKLTTTTDYIKLNKPNKAFIIFQIVTFISFLFVFSFSSAKATEGTTQETAPIVPTSVSPELINDYKNSLVAKKK